MTHTPGPWKLRGANIYTDAKDGTIITLAMIETSSDPWMKLTNPIEQSNACLMAAAPELLYELERITSLIGVVLAKSSVDINDLNLLYEFCKESQSTIFKAKGEETK